MNRLEKKYEKSSAAYAEIADERDYRGLTKRTDSEFKMKPECAHNVRETTK